MKCNEAGCRNCVRREISDFNLSFERFKLPKNHKRCVGCQLGEGALESGLHILLYCAPVEVMEIILEEYKVFCELMDGCCVCMGRGY